MATRDQQLSVVTKASIEALYLGGALLGALGVYSLLFEKTHGVNFLGICFIITALVFQIVTHRSITTQCSRPYCLMGAIIVAVSGILLAFLLRLPWLYRLMFLISFVALAVYIHLGALVARILWQIISILFFSFFTLLFIDLIATRSLEDWMVRTSCAYLLLSVLISIRYHWLKRPESKIGLQDLWERGKLFDIFGLSEDPTSMEITKRYAELLKEHNGHKKIERILKEGFEILLVNETNELYQKSRRVMDDIRKKIGDRRFEKKEAKIWKKLWPEIQERFPLSPESITARAHKELVNKYSSRKY